MEVNNNDPNNNDVIFDTSEDQEDMGGGSSAMSSQLNETSEEADPRLIETSFDSDQSEYPTSSPVNTDLVTISDDQDDPSDFDSDAEEELDPVDYYGTEESEPEEESELQTDDEEPQDNPQDIQDHISESIQELQDDPHNTTADVPEASSSSSAQNNLIDDFHVIKRITPRFSDQKILKYLQRNEDHDHRLFAAVWDLMHAVNRPRSKNSKPPSPALKKAKTENRVLPVPGKPDVFTLGKTKLQLQSSSVVLPEQQNPELANRKDYKRAPKRATVSIDSVDAKKKKVPEAPAPQAGPSQVDEPMETSCIVAKPKLNVGDMQIIQNAAVPVPQKPMPVISVERQGNSSSGGSQQIIRPATFNPNCCLQIITPEDLESAMKNIRERKPILQQETDLFLSRLKDARSSHTLIYVHDEPKSTAYAAKPQTQSQAPFQLERKVISKTQQDPLLKLQSPVPQTNQLIRPAVFNGGFNFPAQNRNLPGPSSSNTGASTSGPSTSGGSSGSNKVEEKPFDFDEGLKRLKNKYVFDYLTGMFSGKFSRKAILQLCLENDGMTQDDMLGFLTDQLLAKVNKMDEQREAEVKQLENNQPTEIQDLQALLQEKWNDLIEIFPDADPEYLKQNAIKYLNDPQGFREFVQTNLENKKYPSKEEYLKKQKVRRQLEQYISNFNVAQFLEIFPDPFEYFLDPKRRTNYSHLSWNYLKNQYNRTRERVIRSAFERYNQNLSLASEELDKIKGDMKTKRYQQKVAIENIPFAQEVAFVRHRQEIKAYLDSIKEKERKEFKKYKKSGGLLECQCCFSDECMPSKCATCDNGHIFCYSCIVRGTESKMADGETHVKCFTDCESEFSLSVLQKVLQPKRFSILLTKRQEAEVKAAGLEGLVSCPFCHFASIPPAEDKVFKCLNQDCMKESCRSCKELNHVPLSCTEAKANDKARHFLEERMTEALIRICYSCKKPFFKEEGCNKMTCNCGAKMCYICGQPVKDYNHFRGQGNDNESLCPLYTDDARLNAEAVRREAERTAENLRARDPNVQLDTERLMPVLPAPRQGPHNYILGRVDVPVRNQNNIPNNVLNNNPDFVPNNNFNNAPNNNPDYVPNNNFNNAPDDNPNNDPHVLYDRRQELMNRLMVAHNRMLLDRPFENNRIIPDRLHERIIPDRDFNQDPITIHDDIPDDILVNPNLTPAVNELPYYQL